MSFFAQLTTRSAGYRMRFFNFGVSHLMVMAIVVTAATAATAATAGRRRRHIFLATTRTGFPTTSLHESQGRVVVVIFIFFCGCCGSADPSSSTTSLVTARMIVQEHRRRRRRRRRKVMRRRTKSIVDFHRDIISILAEQVFQKTFER